MTKERKLYIYQNAVTVVGLTLWVMALARVAWAYSLREQITILALTPVTVVVGFFSHHVHLPIGKRFTREKVTVTLSDAVVLLIACWGGVFPAVLVSGIEGFTSVVRTRRRWSSYLFSSAIMSAGAGISAAALNAVLHYGFQEPSGDGKYPLPAVTVAILVGSFVQVVTNIILLSTLIALRHGLPVFDHLKGFLRAAPLFLPISAASSVMYIAFQHNPLVTAVIGAPVLLSIYFSHHQYQDGVRKRVAVMENAHRQTIEALAVAINAKDAVTHEHVMRVQVYAAGVARLLGCSEMEVEALRAGALLHDIGKIAVPDYILNKPGKLTAAEFEKMKLHTTAGAQILSRVEFPYPIVPVVRHHHERWDGKGYPDGLKEEEIPLTARILSVVDCFDAVREDRQYRKGLTRDEAIQLIMEGSGTQYDPRIVGTFIAHLPEFEAEIQAARDKPLPTFGIEATEKLSEAALQVPPAAGFAEEKKEEAAGVGHDEVKALCDLAQVVIQARGYEAMLAAFTEKLRTVVPYDTCALTLIAPETGEPRVVYAAGAHGALLEGRRIGMGEGVTGWVLANRKAFANTDPKLDLPSSLAERFSEYRTLAAFPVLRDKQRFGVVTLYSSRLTVYTTDQQRLLEEAAALLGAALSSSGEAALPEMQQAPREMAIAPLQVAVVESELKH
ncbi:MAG TPA: HD domain-containing phosphohydrolase [Blastocatellia bacterium]|nr:HD domain-containing phosphohydrolase [Blastocatellia bacterium]